MFSRRCARTGTDDRSTDCDLFLALSRSAASFSVGRRDRGRLSATKVAAESIALLRGFGTVPQIGVKQHPNRGIRLQSIFKRARLAFRVLLSALSPQLSALAILNLTGTQISTAPRFLRNHPSRHRSSGLP